MPYISYFYGIIIRMYYRDHNPPHFHAYYAGHEAIIDIQNEAIIRGDFPKRAERLVLDWASKYKIELLENWDLLQKGQEAKRIKPLDGE